MPGKLPAPYDKYIGPRYEDHGMKTAAGHTGARPAIADEVADCFRPFLS